jgi:hypothetical protein
MTNSPSCLFWLRASDFGSCWLSGFLSFVEPPLRWEDFVVCVCFIPACFITKLSPNLRYCYIQHNTFIKCEVKIYRSLFHPIFNKYVALNEVTSLHDGNNGLSQTGRVPTSTWDSKCRTEETIKGNLKFGGSMWPAFFRIGFGGGLLWALKNSSSTINVQFLDNRAIMMFSRTLRHEVS